jgi:hypothetical protein
MKRYYIFKRSTNEVFKTNDINEAILFVKKNRKDVLICDTTKAFERTLALVLARRINQSKS